MVKKKGEQMMTFRTGINSALKANTIGSVESVKYGNEEAVKILLGEDKALEFINSVKLGEDHPAFPDSYTTVILTTEWAESFAAKVNATPQPMFIGGHAEYGMSTKERAIPDGYLTGAMVMGDELFIRNSMPKGSSDLKKERTQQTANEISAKMLSTSTSSYNLYDIEIDDEVGMKYIAKEATKGISNALVEADMTGSDADIIITSFKAGDGFEINNKGEEHMGDKPKNSEMFLALKNQLESGHLAISEVATSLGFEVRTAEDKLNLKKLIEAEKSVGDITAFVLSVKADRDAAFVSLKDSKIKDKFKDEALIEIAGPLFALKEGNAEAIDAEVERVASLQVFKTIQGKIAGSNFTPGGASDATLDDNSSERMEA